MSSKSKHRFEHLDYCYSKFGKNISPLTLLAFPNPKIDMKPKQPAQSNTEWEVEQIEAWIRIGGKLHYYVNWKNYGKTWEPEENMTNCKKKMSEFYKNIRKNKYMAALRGYRYLH